MDADCMASQSVNMSRRAMVARRHPCKPLAMMPTSWTRGHRSNSRLITHGFLYDARRDIPVQITDLVPMCWIIYDTIKIDRCQCQRSNLEGGQQVEPPCS